MYRTKKQTAEADSSNSHVFHHYCTSIPPSIHTYGLMRALFQPADGEGKRLSLVHEELARHVGAT